MRDINTSRTFWALGKDSNRHLKLVEEKNAICGMPILKNHDADNCKYTCYECSCTADGRYWGMTREESLSLKEEKSNAEND